MEYDNWDEIHLLLCENVGPYQSFPDHEMEGKDTQMVQMDYLSPLQMSSWCREPVLNGFRHHHGQEGTSMFHDLISNPPPQYHNECTKEFMISRRPKCKRLFFDRYETTGEQDDTSPTVLNNVFSSHSRNQDTLSELGVLIDSPRIKRIRGDSPISWSHGTLHIDFLKCILRIGLENIKACNVQSDLEDRGFFVSKARCDSYLHDPQRCEELIAKEYEMAKLTATDHVRSKSKLCKPELHVYPLNPLSSLDEDPLERVVLSYLFDKGIQYAKPQDLFQMMNVRGHQLSSNRIVKSHLQKYVQNSRPSRSAFWDSICSVVV